jgi:hypothetical protein
MTTVAIKKMNTELATLKREVGLLRSAFIGRHVIDHEGPYSPKFVREMLSSFARTPTNIFRGKKTFLDEIKSV